MYSIHSVHTIHYIILYVKPDLSNFCQEDKPRKHRNFYELLNQRNLVYLLKDIIIEHCGPKLEHLKAKASARAYVAYNGIV